MINKGHPYGGNVAMSAIVVRSSGTSKIDYVGDYAFMYNQYEYANYLIDYLGVDNELTLPNDYNGGKYNISWWIIRIKHNKMT